MPRSRVRPKQVGDYKKGEWILWECRTSYQLAEDVFTARDGWAHVAMHGHPLRVCTIWPTVEMPPGFYRELTPEERTRIPAGRRTS